MISMSKKKQTSLPIRSVQRAMHRSKILELIRTAELISRTDIARATGFSQATVTGRTAELIEEGLIEEKQAGAYEGGRPPILLAIRADGVHAIGVNVTLAQIRVVIINFKGELRASHTISTGKNYYSPEEIIEKIVRGIQACMWEANFSKDQIAGVGVGLPGPIDSVSGMMRFLPNYGWKEIPFRSMLQEKINHPVFLDNSSNNLAIAEYWNGSGKGVDNFLVITLENGVGAGVIINGQLVRGHQGIAGEFGHICVNETGPACRCGRRGCIEAYAGNNAIIREARALAHRGMWYSSKIPPAEIEFEEVIAELEYGNNELNAVYAQAGKVLGTGIHDVAMLLNPERVIITGKGVKAGDFLFNSMFRTIKHLKTGKFDFPQTKIIIKEWNESDWAGGSGSLVLLELYKSPVAA
jgi:predicted NBD/HSP70 family sugar kinase